MRDWTRTLRKASFRGVSFYVDEESLPKTGRRIARHEYVKAEEHDTEDMGRLPREFRVRAYIASDQADSEALRLVEACSMAGAFTLVLPFFGSNQVRCEGCGPSRKKDQLGYVSFDLDFVEAGSGGGGFSVFELGDRIAASALDDLADTVSDALDTFPIPF